MRTRRYRVASAVAADGARHRQYAVALFFVLSVPVFLSAFSALTLLVWRE